MTARLRVYVRTVLACLLVIAAARQAKALLGSQDTANAVATFGGIVYVAGATTGSLGGTNQGNDDVFVRACDQNGNVLWTRQFGGPQTDEALGVAADATGVYVAGRTYGRLFRASLGQTDAFVAKYDTSGNMLWGVQFGTATYDRILAAAADGTGVYVAGSTAGTLSGATSAGAEDAFVVKFDGSGNIVWTFQFGSAGTDRAYGVAVDSTGVYFGGRTDGTLPGQTSSGGVDGFMAKLTLSGSLLWDRQFGTPQDDRGWGVGLDSTGAYVCGHAQGSLDGQPFEGSDDAYVWKFDTNGNSIWVREFGTNRFDRSNGVASDGSSVYTVGFTQGNLDGSHGLLVNDDAFIRSYDTAGNVKWTVQFGTTSVDIAYGVATDSTGVYVAGRTQGKLNGQNHISGSDAFLVKFDKNGNTLWTMQFGT